jgi:hypothetical protein
MVGEFEGATALERWRASREASDSVDTSQLQNEADSSETTT